MNKIEEFLERSTEPRKYGIFYRGKLCYLSTRNVYKTSGIARRTLNESCFFKYDKAYEKHIKTLDEMIALGIIEIKLI